MAGWPSERQEMLWGGFSRSRGYRGIRKGWGRGPAVRFRAIRRVYKRKKVTAQEGGGAQKLGELSDVDVSYAVPKRLHTLAFTGSKWIAFADPVKTTGWMIDIRISSLYVATGQHHKVRKVTNSGTRLCSYIPMIRNVVVSEQHTLKTSNSREGILKMISEFSPAGIIGAGKEPTSTILLEVILGDPPDDLVEILPGFKLKWTSAHAQKERGLDQSSGSPPGALYIGWNPTRCRLSLSGYQQDPCWSSRAQKAEVHARRPDLRARLGGP